METDNRTLPEKPSLSRETWKVPVEPASTVNDWGSVVRLKLVTVNATVSEWDSPLEVAVTVTV